MITKKEEDLFLSTTGFIAVVLIGMSFVVWGLMSYWLR